MPTKLALASLLRDTLKATVQVLLETQFAQYFFLPRFGFDNAVDWPEEQNVAF